MTSIQLIVESVVLKWISSSVISIKLSINSVSIKFSISSSSSSISQRSVADAVGASACAKVPKCQSESAIVVPPLCWNEATTERAAVAKMLPRQMD